jgi:outer membrane protein TolC
VLTSDNDVVTLIALSDLSQATGRTIMKSKYLLLIITIAICSSAIPSLAQQAAPEIPLLTLDDAVSTAVNNNRIVKNSVLEAEKFDFRVSTMRTRRLPQFQFAVLGGQLLHSFDFTFEPGVFGTYPNVGPIPSKDTKIRSPSRFTTYVTGAFDQPLSQQYKIGLGIRVTELGRDIAKEDVRAERQKIAAGVRSAYFELVATQAGVDAAREAVKTLEEAKRVTAEHEAQKTVLRADVLEVDARLSKAQYDLSVAENGLATQHEYLNQLMGRNVATPFRVNPLPEEDDTTLTLEAARERAAYTRPEIRTAQLKEKQANYDRRLAKAEYIPDLSLSLRYQGLDNVKVLPANVATAGFLLTWEPFDWGRRHNQVVEKTKTVEQARNGLRETESQIAVEVGAKYRKWKEAALLLKATRTGHEAAAEEFRVTSNKYKEQAALIKDLLQAQARSSETEFQYQQALSSYWSALAELRKAMGDE